jgi:hypothetical protein
MWREEACRGELARRAGVRRGEERGGEPVRRTSVQEKRSRERGEREGDGGGRLVGEMMETDV